MATRPILDKTSVASILDEFATLLELTGANPFKVRAFRNAAPVIRALPEDLSAHVKNGTLRSIKGIGEGIAGIITELGTEGRSKEHQELKKKVPEGLLQVAALRGLGPKRVIILNKKLGVTSIPSLEKACKDGRIAKLQGFGSKTQDAILASITQSKAFQDQFLFPVGRALADEILATLKPFTLEGMCEVAGSLRRRKEVVRDIDIVAASNKSGRSQLMSAFVSHPTVSEVLAEGETKSSVRTKPGIQCDLRVVSPSEFPFAMNYFTGSKEHNIALRSLARSKGWSLNEYGLTPLPEAKRKRIPNCSSEQELYAALGLAYIEPEMRENVGEIEAAMKGELPSLIEEKNLRGTFHCHTTYSDGHNSLKEMVDAARKKGWEYWGVADHSQVAAYARGLNHPRVLAQHKEIESLQRSLRDFRIFKGTECDILSDGSLDFPEKTLALFDYVVVSVHSKFSMTQAEATKRVIRAITSPYATILGHSTGRLLLERDGYPVDLKQVIDAVSDCGKAIEINAHPRRLDLDWRWLRYAKEKGVPIAINPDAHSASGLDDVTYGVGIARKGWLEPGDVVNAWPVRKVERFFARVKTGGR